MTPYEHFSFRTRIQRVRTPSKRRKAFAWILIGLGLKLAIGALVVVLVSDRGQPDQTLSALTGPQFAAAPLAGSANS